MTDTSAFWQDAVARSNVSSWWGAVTAELLARLNVREVVISPGSRSTPLTVACARHPELATRIILDERSAGFFALGLAKSRHRPVALVCTSGTAVANYLPAIVEASESGTPLLVLSADRPAELRFRHAGQTIDQVKIFGDAVRFFAEAPLPEANLGVLRAWRDLLVHAVGRAGGSGSGPVHVNCPFRDPLSPGREEDDSLPSLGAEFFANVRTPFHGRAAVTLDEPLPARGWIVAGPANPEDPQAYTEAVRSLARKLGWAILADALNPLRHCGFESVIAHYDAFLRSDAIAEEVRPAAVIQLGDLPTSKILRLRLADWQLPTWIVDPAPDSRNAVSAPAIPVYARVEDLEIATTSTTEADWINPLQTIEREVATTLESALEAASANAEPVLAKTVLTASPTQTPIFVASSMPVRDAEYFWPVNGGSRLIFFNRGANGIDGTLSTALGMAEGVEKPAILYTGDLSLLHDANGMLAVGSAFTGSLTIVLINNGGGGIFEHLPIASQGELFERCFATPQKVDFAAWARAFGMEHRLIDAAPQLREALATLPERGVRLLECRTDRKADAQWRKAALGAWRTR